MDCGGKHPPFTLTFFQHLNVWEFIAGMLSCIMKGGKAAMSKVNNDNKFLNLPAKLFFFIYLNINCFIKVLVSDAGLCLDSFPFFLSFLPSFLPFF